MSDQQSNTDGRKNLELRSDGTFDITVPDHVGTKIEQRIERTEFDSVDEYVTFVLESLFRELDAQDGHIVGDHSDTHKTDPEDSEAIQERLESLGYL